MPILTTSLYAALLAIICTVLAGMVGSRRGKLQSISLGDGGDPELLVAMRRHMNFVEYVPLALLLMALVELNGGSKTLIHGLGAVLLAARLLHPFGIDANNMMKAPRFIGTFATIAVTLVAAGTLLWQYFG
jgi:uncharacterized membrane protein YecN with MAPEG domain